MKEKVKIEVKGTEYIAARVCANLKSGRFNAFLFGTDAPRVYGVGFPHNKPETAENLSLLRGDKYLVNGYRIVGHVCCADCRIYPDEISNWLLSDACPMPVRVLLGLA